MELIGFFFLYSVFWLVLFFFWLLIGWSILDSVISLGKNSVLWLVGHVQSVFVNKCLHLNSSSHTRLPQGSDAYPPPPPPPPLTEGYTLSNRKFTKKYCKNQQLMNRTLKDLWKYNKNEKKTYFGPRIKISQLNFWVHSLHKNPEKKIKT